MQTQSKKLGVDVSNRAHRMPRNSALLYRNKASKDATSSQNRGLLKMQNGDSYWVGLWIRRLDQEPVLEVKLLPKSNSSKSMSDYVYQGVEEPSIASIEQSHIAQSLAAELQNPAQPGERHSQIKRTILPMLELGLCDAAVFTQFRRMYGVDFLDSEIEALIAWGRARLSKVSPRRAHHAAVKASAFTPEEKIQNAIDWLGGFRIDPADLWDASQIRDDNESDAIVYLSLFEPDDFVNINARYIIRKLQDGSQKAVLCGPGQTMLAAEWVELIHDAGTPQDRAGAWVRINPLRTRRGNSPSGAHTDADVLSYVRLLLESDLLPYDIALALFAKIALPICAIIDSAGRGPHAIVSIRATDARDFASKAGEIIESLEPFGIDSGNSNPSRYSRLPGARRIIGARADASIQKLLFVAHNPRLEEFSSDQRRDRKFQKAVRRLPF